ncbi:MULTISPECIES: hypothetical protein [Bacillaceae]|uniref:Preprotein translocase subunit SecD n=1 Tax=Evansella alkalicola TaxID=745819 RepID=A0ABS6JUL0_9BACI|nr:MULTISPECIES: hypothetical protein [Bacillaceae]MBU9721771.1 hypothetical protein [Bacillus alkalicola]
MKRFIILLFLTVIPLALLGCSEDTASANDSERTSTEIVLKDEDGNILATTEDFIPGSAEVTFEAGIRFLAIEAEFTDPKKLEQITKDNLNESIDFYFGEELLASPFVTKEITNGVVVIDGGFSEELAEELVEAINNQ